MAESYQVTTATRVVNQITSTMARLGLGRTQVLVTEGHSSGEPREVPVSPIEVDGVEYLVAPYGEVSWVRNVRAQPDVILRHGSRRRRVRLEEVHEGHESAPVVAAYHAREGYARRYMDVPDDPSLEDFRRAAHRFPVFRVTHRG